MSRTGSSSHPSRRAEVIRDEEQYAGVRVTLACSRARADVTFHVDVNVGDPITPAP